MSSTLNRLALCLLVIGSLCGCVGFEQINRDNLRYNTLVRGQEEYVLTGAQDSLAGMQEVAKVNTEFYEKYKKTLANYDAFVKERLLAADKEVETKRIELRSKEADLARKKEDIRATELEAKIQAETKRAQEAQASKSTSKPKKEEGGKKRAESANRSLDKDLRGFESILAPFSLLTPTPPGGDTKNQIGQPQSFSQVGVIWPIRSGNDLRRTETKFQSDGKTPQSQQSGPDETLVRALSSTAAVAQMRDLITEPAFPHMVPVRRTVNLGCLPPADNVVFESIQAIKASAEAEDKKQSKTTSKTGDDTQDAESLSGRGAKVGFTSNFQTTAVKAIQETQKTWFLQWALFRLCEASINSSEFRNTLPVVVHDIVRRTAEMSDQVEESIAKRVESEEATRRAVIDAQKALRLEELKGESAIRIKDMEQSIAEMSKQVEEQRVLVEKQKQRTACVEAAYAKNPKLTAEEKEAACPK
jgi:hypothetical protein